jgi:DinB superfamily
MNLQFAISRLEVTPDVLGALLRDVSLELVRWKPKPESWSMLEVVCHMADEDRKDFRPRLKSLLFDTPPGASITPIDPPAWVIESKYNDSDLTASLEDFRNERATSLAWLRTLPTDLVLERSAPDRDITAGQVLFSWVAHDYLHIRQITRLHYDFLALEAQGYDIGYAGKWR